VQADTGAAGIFKVCATLCVSSSKPHGFPSSSRSAACHHQEDNDATVGFGDDMPAFMRIVAKV